MEDRETPRMRKYGESKTTRIMMATVRASLPVRDLENFRPMDFCWTECTYNVTMGLVGKTYVAVEKQQV